MRRDHTDDTEDNTEAARSNAGWPMLTALLEASHVASVDALPELVARFTAPAGYTETQIYLVDLQQEVLRPLAGHGPELLVDTTLAGRAFQEVRTLPKTDDTGATEYWWVPLLNGTARLGVLRVRTTSGDLDHQLTWHLSSMVALLLTSAAVYSDTYPRLVRSRPMNVAAEMQWRLTPPLTYANERVTVSAVLEPAYEVGGDAFDYALSGDVLHLAVFDAMGHDVSAGLTSNLAVAAGRNHRRQGLGLADNSAAIERVLIEEFGRAARFVTAIMGDLDLNTGVFTWVNRGHHLPVLIREGRWPANLECPPSHPMGLALGLPVTVCREQLQPGDRLLLYTDGITEARDARGREFGLQRFTDFVIRHHASGLPVPETLRRLVRAVLAYHDGMLRDDATVLLAEWNGPGDGGPITSGEAAVPRESRP